VVGGCPVRGGDRLLLVARHAAGAHRRDPDGRAPAGPGVARLVFGAGPHACPGARLATAALADVLEALAPYRPVVTRSRVDRRAALPGWRELTVRAGTGGFRPGPGTLPGRPGARPRGRGPAAGAVPGARADRPHGSGTTGEVGA
ncbi:hypothetical protein AB0O29_27950, partial [Streptomyces sp. NPDC089915]